MIYLHNDYFGASWFRIQNLGRVTRVTKQVLVYDSRYSFQRGNRHIVQIGGVGRKNGRKVARTLDSSVLVELFRIEKHSILMYDDLNLKILDFSICS